MCQSDGVVDETMLACYYSKYGNAKCDKIGQIRRVKPEDLKKGELLVKVYAASLNPVDYKTRGGRFQHLLSKTKEQNDRQPVHVHGFDFSGVVVHSQDNQYGFEVGSAVFGMVKGLRTGSLAEYMIVDADICAIKPENISHIEAASVPLVGITAIKAFLKCGLKEVEKQPEQGKGPRVLVLGGAGGVGSLAIQLAKKLFGASFVATTASSGAKTEFVKKLGADQVIDYRSQKFEKELFSLENEKLFDAIFDCTGEAEKCITLLRSGGGLVSILANPTNECVQDWLQQADVHGCHAVTFGVEGFLNSSVGASLMNCVTGARAISSECKKRGATFSHVIGTGNKAIVELLATQLSNGNINAVIDKTYPLSDALEAIKHVESGRSKGKVVVTMFNN